MRRDDHAEALVSRLDEGGYLFPDYGGYCIPGLLGSVLSVHDARPEGVPVLPEDVFSSVDLDEIEHVVFVLVDGLGYDSWCRFEESTNFDSNLLGAFSNRGTVTPLTSVFPSETAAALPTILTGQYPIEHGMLGWWAYLDGVGRIQTLPYQTEGDEDVRDVFPDAPHPWETLYDADPLGPRVDPPLDTAFYTPAGTDSDYPHTFGMVAQTYHSYETIPQLGVNLRREVEAGRDQVYAYVPEVDAASHREGPQGAETTAQLAAILDSLERQLCDRLDPAIAERTLLILSADHGHIDTGGDNIDISGFDPLFDALETVDGDPIPPLGGPRQLQLHLQDGRTDEVAAALESEFDCLTITREEYERRNLFGPGDVSASVERLPDLLCIPRTRAMWDTVGSLEHVGVHGGLHREEMLVPFAVARATALAQRRTSQ